ncbi:hypothetical protein TB2_031523 [Malus domestica]|uniref:Uncharacterized protein n=1 Tax=Malus domestica TaxID=3750 RepID=A0A498K0J2_MALDO|nr:hypothetical protein DVH24_001131 [Malus domestica]
MDRIMGGAMELMASFGLFVSELNEEPAWKGKLISSAPPWHCHWLPASSAPNLKTIRRVCSVPTQSPPLQNQIEFHGCLSIPIIFPLFTEGAPRCNQNTKCLENNNQNVDSKKLENFHAKKAAFLRDVEELQSHMRVVEDFQDAEALCELASFE